MPDELAARLQYEWWFWARPKQKAPPGEDWFVWLLRPGRGFGKTRAGSEWVHARGMAGDERREMLLVGKTPADVRDFQLEGPAGILTVTHPLERPEFAPSNRLLVWPTGARGHIRSGANPEELRGFGGDTAWLDELAAWKYPKLSWDNLMFGLREARVGEPQVCVTTTPKPIQLIKDLINWAKEDPTTVRVVSGSSYENSANLSERYYTDVIGQYEGTHFGAQEIYGQLLSESPGALWTRKLLERQRMAPTDVKRDMFLRVVVAIDPAGSNRKSADLTGIVVAGVTVARHAVVLEDLSGRYSPDEWARRAVEAYRRHQADRIVCEVNYGGDMVESTIRTISPVVSIEKVHATRGSFVRAEPVAAVYEQGRIWHAGHFELLEDAMCTWVQGEHCPDRLAALVWAGRNLLVDAPPVQLMENANNTMTRPSRWT